VHVLGLHGENAVIAISLLPWIGLLSVFALVTDVLNSTLAGLGRFDLANYTQAGAQTLSACCSVGLLVLGHGLVSLLFGNWLMYITLQIVNTIYIVRIAKVPACSLIGWHKNSFCRLVRFGGGVFAGGLLNMLLNPFNRVVLARFGGLSAVTVYDIAFTTSLRLRGFLEAGLRAIMPEISRVGVGGNPSAKAAIQRINRHALNMILLGGIPGLALAAVFAGPVLRIWLGARYSGVLPSAVRIAMLGSFLSLVGTPAFYTLMGLGNT